MTTTKTKADTKVATNGGPAALPQQRSGRGLGPEQIDLVKRTIAHGASNDELALFLHQCERTGLDPFSRQIYCIKRRSQNEAGQWVDKMETQVAIDGLRLVADRTERYTPGREPTYSYDDRNHLLSATAYVKKLVAGAWHEVAATAHYAEYVQTRKDGQPTRFWAQMPHVMLAKCAEALALRRAFPMELSGLYTPEEMGDDEPEERPAARPVAAIAHKPAEETKVEAPPAMKALPRGKELVDRLRKKEDALAKEGLCKGGEMMAYLSQRGAAAAKADPKGVGGWGPNVEEWSGKALEGAVQLVRSFEVMVREAQPLNKREMDAIEKELVKANLSFGDMMIGLGLEGQELSALKVGHLPAVEQWIDEQARAAETQTVGV